MSFLALVNAEQDPLFGVWFARAAYFVIFGVLFGYVLRLHLAQRAMERRLEAAERRMEGEEGVRR